jgi:YVTN family beta-propeller protein
MKTLYKAVLITLILGSTEPALKGMELKRVIRGNISPKSIVHSGNGLFFAQNMMYRHSITVYNRRFQLVKILPDSIRLDYYGYKDKKGTYRGSPVEVAFSHYGKFAWVSNYCMFGPGYNRPGHDRCTPSGNYDKSFLYKINTDTFTVEDVIEVGSVPKYVATTHDNKLVLVSNWCSWDLSVVDAETNREIRRIRIGRYPRGIVVSPAFYRAYIAVMGSRDIAVVDLKNFTVSWMRHIGRSPRHLNIGPAGRYLYATLNGEGTVAKIDTISMRVLKKVRTGRAPRSMAISDDGKYLYVVNYHSNTMSKVRTDDMRVLASVKTNHHPIGITYDPEKREIWVACYSGSIMIFGE